MSQIKTLGIVLIQMGATSDKETNLKKAEKLIREAVVKYKPKIVCLPECFNSPYGIEHFDKYAEDIPNGGTSKLLAKLAKELKIYIICSIPERDGVNKKILYNSAPVFGPNGELICTHRKVHLFDVDTPTIKFKESAALTPGDAITMFEIDGVKIGVCVCMDVFYDEFFKLYRKNGCELMIIPSAFPKEFGMEWDLHNRSRASDNQFYLATISPPRIEPSDSYIAWGHSMVVDPWGKVVKIASATKEESIYYEIDLPEIELCRKSIPIFSQRRSDLYDTILL